MRRWLGLLLLLNACGSCAKNDASTDAAAASPGRSDASTVTAEVLPRCRGEAQRLSLGDGAVVGNVAVGAGGLLVGVVRASGGKRTASILRASLDLASQQTIDLGPSFGDDPPPSPHWNGSTPYAFWLERPARDGGPRTRTLKIARLTDDRVGLESQVEQQADESTAFDVVWSDGVGIAAWDEDAPNKPDAALPSVSERGYVKVQLLGGDRPRVASPDSSDADSPQLVARPGGFWLAWLARRVEEAPSGIEGPGEDKDFRWVEAVMLDARGEAQGPVRRVSSERGRAVAFDVARNGADLVVLVQDEAAAAEGGGARLLRYVVGAGAAVLPGTDLVDGGVGHALAEVVAAPDGNAARWLAWSDVAEHAHLTALGNGLAPTGPGAASLEPAFDGARVLAESSGMTAGLYVLEGDKPEIRRFACR